MSITAFAGFIILIGIPAAMVAYDNRKIILNPFFLTWVLGCVTMGVVMSITPPIITKIATCAVLTILLATLTYLSHTGQRSN